MLGLQHINMVVYVSTETSCRVGVSQDAEDAHKLALAQTPTVLSMLRAPSALWYTKGASLVIRLHKQEVAHGMHGCMSG